MTKAASIVRPRNPLQRPHLVMILSFQVSLAIEPGYIVCECHHLSMFAGNMLVAPNKVDLFKLKLFLGVFHNPIVVAFLLAFWCLFVIVTVWARRKDGKHPIEVNYLIQLFNFFICSDVMNLMLALIWFLLANGHAFRGCL